MDSSASTATPSTDAAQPNTAINKVQVGPQSSLSEDCPKHPGFKIIFRADPSDDSDAAGETNLHFCEKCFAEMYKGK